MARKRKGPLARVIGLVTVGLTVGAVVQELAKPAAERTWHGRIAYVPYDFRVPTLDRFLQRWWNPDDPRLLTPKTFGLGWTINIGRLVRLVRDQQG